VFRECVPIIQNSQSPIPSPQSPVPKKNLASSSETWRVRKNTAIFIVENLASSTETRRLPKNREVVAIARLPSATSPPAPTSPQSPRCHCQRPKNRYDRSTLTTRARRSLPMTGAMNRRPRATGSSCLLVRRNLSLASRCGSLRLIDFRWGAIRCRAFTAALTARSPCRSHWLGTRHKAGLRKGLSRSARPNVFMSRSTIMCRRATPILPASATGGP
jgi:hypothetical protein